jgi:hypothetical protein
MRKAIARADVGDEQCGEDPTVRALGERVADLLGHVPTGAVTSRVFTGHAGWINPTLLGIYSCYAWDTFGLFAHDRVIVQIQTLSHVDDR